MALTKSGNLTFGSSGEFIWAAAKIDTNKALMLSADGNDLNLWVVTANGTGSPPTAGTAVILDSKTSSSFRASVVSTVTDEAVVIYALNDGTWRVFCAHITISGTVPTVAGTTQLESGTRRAPSLSLLSTDKFIGIQSSAGFCTSFVITKTGSSFSRGTLETVTPTFGGIYPTDIAALSATKAMGIFATDDVAEDSRAVLVSISGTTVTHEESLKLSTSVHQLPASHGRFAIRLNATKAVIGYRFDRMQTAVDNGTTITLGTEFFLSRSSDWETALAEENPTSFLASFPGSGSTSKVEIMDEAAGVITASGVTVAGVGFTTGSMVPVLVDIWKWLVFEWTGDGLRAWTASSDAPPPPATHEDVRHSRNAIPGRIFI